MGQLILPIANLDQRHPGLTPAVADCFHEAARVCLDRHHVSPASFVLNHEGDQLEAVIQWQVADQRCRAAHAYETKATEEGAYACALAAIEITERLVAVHQAESKTGADYYIGEPGRFAEDLEDCLRLEISGLDRCNQSAVELRIRQKIQQVLAGKSNLPALAGVVGFQAQLIKIRRV
jgi:hypothetical protein